MSYAIILFDLDGTLTDSAEGIVNSVVYALERKHSLSKQARSLPFRRVSAARPPSEIILPFCYAFMLYFQKNGVIIKCINLSYAFGI